jgi:hypothetical protein
VVADTKRGKTTPVNAREGCLLLIRALIKFVGKPAEPYVVGAFLAAELEECTSAHSAVREAAEDTCTELLALVNPWACRGILAPILLQSLRCTEWRIKAAALERPMVERRDDTIFSNHQSHNHVRHRHLFDLADLPPRPSSTLLWLLLLLYSKSLSTHSHSLLWEPDVR